MSKARSISILMAILVIATLWPSASPAFTPDDPYYSQQWGLTAIGMESAWDYNQGGSSSVKVAVIDSGVNYNISDFSSTNFDTANFYDYIDGDTDPTDLDGHGTHVTATIAQSTDNGIGTSGIAYNTTILPIRVLDENGVGSFEDIVAAIYLSVDAGADIINLSLGAYIGTEELYTACEYAYNNGVLVVAAAGNSAPVYTLPDDPAWYESTLVVGSVDEDLNHSWFSQNAKDQADYGLVAPGESILQTVTEDGLYYSTGTSMATAFVSGVAALVLAEAYDLGISIPETGTSRVDWLRDVLTSTAQDLGLSGPDSTYGYGLVRADLALAYLNTLAVTTDESTTDDSSNQVSDTTNNNSNSIVWITHNNRTSHDNGR